MKQLIAVLSILVFAGTCPGNAGEIEGWTEYKLGELGVMLPSVEGWERWQEEHEVGAGRAERLPDGSTKLFYYLTVGEYVYPENYSDWIAPEIAMSHREWEVTNMREGVEAGEFALEELELGEEERGSYTLYFLKNLKAADPETKDWTWERQVLYLLFPTDYAEKRRFYGFFLGAVCVDESCSPNDLELEELLQVFDHLRMGPATTGKSLVPETFRDQGQILDTDGLVILGTDFFSQSITAGITGGLAAIEVLYELNIVAPIQYSVYSGGNPVTGDLLYTELIESPVFETGREGVFRWLLPSDTLFFEAGEQFTFAFQALSSDVVFSASDRPDYIGGELFRNGVPSSKAGDVAFISYVVPAPGGGSSSSPSEK